MSNVKTAGIIDPFARKDLTFFSMTQMQKCLLNPPFKVVNDNIFH